MTDQPRGLLALIACLGLMQLSHETTPALAQLGFTALAFYGLAYWYTWQVTILGLGPIWMGSPRWIWRCKPAGGSWRSPRLSLCWRWRARQATAVSRVQPCTRCKALRIS